MPATKVEKIVTIPELRTRQMLVRIEGQRPLLCNRYSKQAMEKLLGTHKGEAKLTKEIREPDKEFEGATYLIEPGRYGFPLLGVQKALITAGGRFADEHQTFLRGALWLLGGDLIEIKGPPPIKRMDRVRQAGIGRKMNIRIRAEFFPWAMSVPVEYVENWLTPDVILNLFRIAGSAVGIGDWRIELANGFFGKFKVVGAEEL